MRTLFNKLASHALLRAAAYIILGLLMLLFPAQVTSAIVYILAGWVAVLGILNIVSYLRSKGDGATMFDLVSGILQLVLAVMMIVFSKFLVSILPVFLGVLIIIGAAGSLAQTIRYGQIAGRQNILLLVLYGLLLIGGIVVVFNPFQSALFLMQVFGAITIAGGISELISAFTWKGISKNAPDN